MPPKASPTAVVPKPANSPVRRPTPPAKLIPLPDAESPAQAKPARQKRVSAAKPAGKVPPGYLLTPSFVVNGTELGKQVVKIPAKMAFFNKPKKRNKAAK